MIATSFCRLYLFGKLKLQEVEDLRLCLKPAGGGTIAEQASGIFSEDQSSEMCRWQSEANNQLLSFDTLQSCDKGSREVQERNYMMSLFWGFVIWYHDTALK